MSLSYLRGQLSDAQQRIAQLQQEHAGLEQFAFQVSSDSVFFESQLLEKRTSIAKAGNLLNAKVAAGYYEKMSTAFGQGFQSNVYSCFDGVIIQVNQAIKQVEDEIAEQKRIIASLEEQISDEQARGERRRQEEIQKENLWKEGR